MEASTVDMAARMDIWNAYRWVEWVGRVRRSSKIMIVWRTKASQRTPTRVLLLCAECKSEKGSRRGVAKGLTSCCYYCLGGQRSDPSYLRV